MKYILHFNEAIIDWKSDNITSFYNEIKEILNTKNKVVLDEAKVIGNKYDIEIVDYNQFIKELPTDKIKKDAPPKNSYNFALVNPNTNKIRLVLNSTTSWNYTPSISIHQIDMIYHMLKHENIHIGQKNRRGDNPGGEFMGDARDVKSYFSNKDEIMAFAQSACDMIMSENPKDLKSAIKMITKIPLWRPISQVDDKLKNRYKKYIYLYLESEFEKLK